jgi:hypothetical protein
MNGSPQRLPSVNTVFCSDIRFKWLYPSVASSTQGGGLLRAEVRVYWSRTSVPDLRIPLGDNPCSWTALNVTSPEGLKAYHFVYMTTALLQHDQ